MKKIIVTFGLISGGITCILMVITMPMFKSGNLDMKNGELIGYTGMVVALSLIFFAIKSYRDNHLSGTITFWQGCQVGLLIALIASVMYALTWEYLYRNLGSAFFDKMMADYHAKMVADNVPTEKIAESKAMMAEYAVNPFMRFGVSLFEIFPVGLGLTLLSAGLLRMKNFLPKSA